VLSVPPENIIVDGTVSVASYKPKTEMDYGTLLCWGDNELGGRRFPAFSTSFLQVRFQLNCSRELNMAYPCMKDYRTDLKRSFGLPRVYEINYGDIHVNLGKLTSYTIDTPKLRFGSVP